MPTINVYGPGYRRAMQDEHVTADVKGFLAVLAAHGDGATIRRMDLPNEFKEGTTRLQTLIKQAEAAGYLRRQIKRDNGGTFDYSVWTVGRPNIQDVVHPLLKDSAK